MKCKEIRIGALYPLTGNRQLLGQSIRRALELYVDLINHQIIAPPALIQSNLDGARIRLIWGDTKGDPIFAQEEVKRLIEDERVTSIIGCYQSSVTQAVSFQAEIYNIPFLSPDADASILTQRGFNWFFRTGPTSRIYSEKIFDMLGKTRFSAVTLGSLSENSLLGQDEVQAMINLSRKYRHKITIIELFEAITNNQLHSIKSSNPDMLVIPQAEEDDLKTIRILKEIGYCPLAYLDQTGFFALEELLKIAGVYADHVISTAAWALGLTRKLPLAREINQLYKARYGDNLNSVNALSFTGIYVLVDAIARAHSESQRDIRRSLINTDIPGGTLILPWDGIHFDETGQNIFAESMVLQVLNKTNKIVWPKDLAETNVIIPAYPCD